MLNSVPPSFCARAAADLPEHLYPALCRNLERRRTEAEVIWRSVCPEIECVSRAAEREVLKNVIHVVTTINGPVISSTVDPAARGAVTES